MLVLPARLEAELRALAEAAYPEEGCALLIGTRAAEADGAAWRVTRLVPAANVHADPRHAFELDPRVLFAELRALRGQDAATGECLLGHAHSHPDAAARPSETDRAMAWEPGMIWVILGVERRHAGPPLAWRVFHDAAGAAGFEPISLLIGRESP